MKRKYVLQHSAAEAMTGGGAPAAPAEAAPAVEQGTAPVTAPAAESWYSGIQSDELKTWIEAKGYKDPAAVAESAHYFEKLIGHEKAGRTLVMPKEDATPEEMQAFHAKLGVPDSPDGYKLPIPEGQDDAFSKTAASWMHKHGVLPKAAEGLAAEWNEYQVAQVAEMQKQQAANADKEFNETVAKWGNDADANLEISRRAAAEYIPAANADERKEIIKKLEFAMGTGKFLEMFVKLGGGLREGSYIDGGGAGNMGGMSPAEAQQKIASLKSDADWSAKYLAGDKGKLEEMTRLTKIAHPSGG